MNANTRSHADYNVGWVCSRPKEQTAAIAMLDEKHESLSKPSTDTNAYTLGSIGHHNIVIACLPKGHVGPHPAATVATQMIQTFPFIKIGLMVGIGGGIPPKVRLGDVVVSTPGGQFPGVVQWDLGKSTEGRNFKRTGSLNNPPNSLLSALGKLESKHELEGSNISVFLEQFRRQYPLAAKNYLKSTSLKDVLFKSGYLHVSGNPTEDNGVDNAMDADDDGASDDEEEEVSDHCSSCDASQTVRRNPQTRSMRIHHGLIASSNTTIEDAEFRDRLNKEFGGKVLCVEMEAAGLMNSFPCIIIRGICDYADSHKNKSWQKHAAAVAAAFAKELLGCVQSNDVEGERPIRDILNDVMDELNQMNRDIKAGFRETKKGLDNLHDAKTAEKRDKTLAWLSSVDSSSMQHDYIEKCEPGTGEAFLDSEEFHQWLNTPQATLFCPGIPGAGKTFQTAIIIDHLINKFRENNTIGVAFFFYRFDRQDAQKPKKIIANLIKQLVQKHEPSFRIIKELHEYHKIRGSRPLFKDLFACLRAIIPLFSRAYIIVDALDECDDNDYSRTKLLDSLFAVQDLGANIYATSRKIDIIEKRFEGALTRYISPSTHDISTFLDVRMPQLPDFVRSDIALQIEIKHSIESAIEGMFLLAQLYIDSLVGKRSPASIRASLAGLKKSSKETKNRSVVLGAAYHKSMERIERQKGDLPNDAMIILAWVVKSKRPLSIYDLRVILAVDVERSVIDEDNFPTAQHVTQACAPLVVIESTARLVHYTAQEYFEELNNPWMEKSQMIIANICMSFLSFSEVRSVFGLNIRCFDDDKTSFHGDESFYRYRSLNGYRSFHRDESFYRYKSFHEYATRYLGHHVAEALVQGLEVQRVVDFLENNAKSNLWYDSLMQIDLSDRFFVEIDGLKEDKEDEEDEEDYILRISEQVVALHVAACLGLSDVVAELVSKECNPDIKDKRGRTPLWWASYHGHAGVIEVLLKRNVNVEAKDNIYYQTPLKLVTKRGAISAVKLLLDKGADVESGNRAELIKLIYSSREFSTHLEFFEVSGQSFNWHNENPPKCLTPLASAAMRGYKEISILLLNKGAKIESKTAHEPTISALHIAMRAGHRNIVDLLLSRGSDIEMQDERGLTSLHIATKIIDQSMIELLLANGADVMARTKGGQTALHIAANSSSGGVAQLLLAYGANVKIQDSGGSTALHFAAQSGNGSVAELLLAYGANVKIQDNGGSTALHIAAKSGNGSVAELLLAHNANAELEVRDEKGWTALHIAAKSYSINLVELLLAHGADVRTRNKEGWTALHIATRHKNPAIVNLLLTHGGNIEDQNEDGETPLIIASKHGLQEIANILIAQGANMAAHDDAGHSVLSYTVASHLWQTVELLASKGFTPEKDDIELYGGRMLHIAIDKNDCLVVDWLLKNKADVNYFDIKAKYSPLHRAEANGCAAMVARLLEADGIDAEAKNLRSGFDALTMALRNGNKEIAKLIINSGKVRTAFGRTEFLDFLKKNYR